MLPDSLRAVSVPGLAIWLCGSAARPASAADSGVAVLLVDTDRVAGTIDERIYGQFLEEINHSVVDGLYAEQARGQGFEGKDFADYWTVAARTLRIARVLRPPAGATKAGRFQYAAQRETVDDDLGRHNTTQVYGRHRHVDAAGIGHRDRRPGEGRPP